MNQRLILLCLLVFSIMNAQSLQAGGDLTKRAIRLEPLLIDANDGFSSTEINLETGIYYRLRIQGDGRDTYSVVLEELSDAIWIDRVVIEDTELTVTGLGEIELEGENEVDIFFIPIRTGRYEYYVDQLRSVGFVGEISIK